MPINGKKYAFTEDNVNKSPTSMAYMNSWTVMR